MGVGLCLEIAGNGIVYSPWQWHAFNKRVSLPSKVENRFVKDHALIFISEHAHKTLHEVLLALSASRMSFRTNSTCLNLNPYIIIPFQHV